MGWGREPGSRTEVDEKEKSSPAVLDQGRPDTVTKTVHAVTVGWDEFSEELPLPCRTTPPCPSPIRKTCPPWKPG